MAIFDWFKQPASNAMLDNSFRNNFYQTNVQPVQSGATNIRPTNWQALRNWTPWKAFMPQSMGGTFHTGGTPQALSALSKAKNVGVGAARTVFGIPGLVASSPFIARSAIEALTKRDPNATETSMFGLNINDLEDKAAAYDAANIPLQNWGSEMGVIPGANLPDPVVTPTLNKLDPNRQHILKMQDIDRGNIDNKWYDNIKTPVMAGLEWLGEKFKRPEAKQRAYDAIMGSMDSQTGRGKYKGQEFSLVDTPSGLKVSSDLLFNKNFDSMFGSKSLEEMEQKKIDWAMNRYNKMGRKGLSTNIFNALVNRGLIDSRGATQKVPIKNVTTTQSPSGVSVHGGGDGGRHDYTRDRGGGYTLGGGFSRSSKPGADTRGHHSWAQGGRVGLYAGGDPEEVQEDLNIYQFMQDQGVPYGDQASAVDPMDALNDMSMDIFGKPLHELTGEEYQMLIDLANDQASGPQEEIVEEGIASLV